MTFSVVSRQAQNTPSTVRRLVEKIGLQLKVT
jgi:hypothetical protein